ncbi:MAG: hypothetical protein WA820_09410, partial [Bradyrhizobium sp.]
MRHQSEPGKVSRAVSVRALSGVFAFRSHIERLIAACTLAGTKLFLKLPAHRTDFIRHANPLKLDEFYAAMPH